MTTTLTTKSAPKPARRGGRYAGVKNQPREDLPGLKPRSSWDANLLRLMIWFSHGNDPLERLFNNLLLRRDTFITAVQYETQTFFFPGSKTTGNAKYIPDIPFQVATVYHPGGLKQDDVYCDQYFLEGKGSLKEGGWLPEIDLTQLAGIDDDSRIKLQRWLRYYPTYAKHTLVIGHREYAALTKVYKSVVLHWE